MQQRPDLITLLGAVDQFLRSDLRPVVEDRALRFRLLIASNLLRQVAAELGAQDTLRSDELRSLAALLDEPAGHATGDDRQTRIAALDQALAARIRDPETTTEQLAAARQHLMSTLAATLEATDPKFDLSLDIES